MLELYYTRREISSSAFLGAVLRERHIAAPVLRGERGKPRLAGDPVFFSLTHSGGMTAAVFCGKEVGLDAEDVCKTRAYPKIIENLSPAEKAEITDMPTFLQHWTAKESYVKFRGETLGKLYRRLSFVGGNLLLDGKPLPVALRFGTLCDGRYVFCVCSVAAEELVLHER